MPGQVIYRRGGVCLGYGLKFWPKEVQDLVDTEPNLSKGGVLK
ncbi:MAG: hypothetical protein QOG23_3743 [Blastocatellia bacterium]|jgi:hypothetical protein|nr:hypothetical protein [Blastocatellia bacterium]